MKAEVFRHPRDSRFFHEAPGGLPFEIETRCDAEDVSGPALGSRVVLPIARRMSSRQIVASASIMLSATASATLTPSTAADRMPPA